MAEAAHVQSQPVIEDFRAALLVFGAQCQNAIDELNAEVRRFADWIEHDRPAYWKRQVQLAERGVHDSKLSLERCLMSGIAGERPACREEKMALRQAQKRLESCRDHVQQVKHWSQQIHHEQAELSGRLAHLGRLVEWNVPQAAATLARILDRLDAYAETQAVVTGTRAPEASKKSTITIEPTEEEDEKQIT